MTLKSSSLIKFAENSRRRLWTYFLAALAMFFTMPVLTMLTMSGYAHQLEEERAMQSAYADTLVRMMREAYAGAVGFSTENLLLAILIAALFAIQGFSYLYSQKKMDFYMSQPVALSDRFRKITANSIVWYAIIYVVCLVCTLPIGAAYGVFYGAVLMEAAAALVLNLLVFLCAYFITVLAAMLVGDAFTAVLGSVVFFGFEPAVRMIRNYLVSTFFVSHYNPAGESGEFYVTPVYYALTFVGRIRRASRAVPYYYTAPVRSGDIYSGFAKACGVLIVGIAVFGVLAYITYKKRKTESYNKPMAFAASKPIIEFCIVAPLVAAAGVAVADATHGYGFGIFSGAALFGLALHGVVRLIFERELKGILGGGKAALVSILAGCLTLAFFRYDVSGYDSYIPKAEDIAAISVTQVNDYAFSYIDLSSESGYGQEVAQAVLEGMNSESEATIEAARTLYAQWQAAGYPRWGMPTPFRGGLAVPEETRERSDSYAVKYVLKSGKTVYRTFFVPTQTAGAELEVITSDPAFRNVRLQILTPEFAKLVPGLNAYFGNGYQDRDREVDAEALYEAYVKDLAQYDYDFINHNEPTGVVSFSGRIGGDETRYMAWRYPVYATFTNTIEVLENAGIDTETVRDGISHKQVESIMVGYNQYAGSEGIFPVSDDMVEVTVEITDPAEVDALLDVTRLSSYFDVQDGPYRCDPMLSKYYDMYMNPTYTKDVVNPGRWQNLEIVREIPDFLVERIKEGEKRKSATGGIMYRESAIED